MKKFHKQYIILFGLMAVFFFTAAIVILTLVFQRNIPKTNEVGSPQPLIEDQRILTVASRDIPVEVARTEEETRRGLSFRKTLPEDAGMYFVFPVAEPLSFWMYGMKFPLDIIFIRDGLVLNVEEHVPHPTHPLEVPRTARSSGQADTVLEIHAGKAAEWGISPGDEVFLSPAPSPVEQK